MKKEQEIFKCDQTGFQKESNATFKNEKFNWNKKLEDRLQAYQTQLTREFVKWKPYRSGYPDYNNAES